MPKAAEVAAERPQVVIQTAPAAAEEKPERQRREPIEFWTYIAGLSPQDWKRHTAYLYRTRPNVGAQQRERYLAVLGEPFTIETIKERYGGEQFNVKLIRDGKMFQDFTFDIEAAPKYDREREIPPRTSDNETVRMLVEKVTEQREENPAVETAVGKAMDIMGKAYDTALERAMKSGAGAGDGGAEFTKLLVVMMQGQQQLMTALVTGILNRRAEEHPASDPLKNLDGMMGIFAKLQEFAGSNGARRSSITEALIEKAIDKAPEVVREIRTGIERVGNQKIHIESLRAGAAVPVPAPATAPVPRPAPMSVPMSAPTSAPAAPAAPLQTQPMPPMQAITEEDAWQALGAKKIVSLIFEGADGGTVMQALEFVNPVAFEYVLNLDAAGIRDLMAKDGILAQALNYPHLAETLEQAVEYCQEEKAARAAEPASEEEPPPAN